jgi:hypothetical protein
MPTSWLTQVYRAPRGGTEQRLYSRTSVGKGRAFWVVMKKAPPDSDELYPVIASGYAASVAEAERMALEHAGPQAAPLHTYLAAMEHRKQVAQQRTDPVGTTPPEFLYDWHEGWSDDGHHYVSVSPHWIIKRTKAHIYVHEEPWAPASAYHPESTDAYYRQHPHLIRSVKVDRVALEREGHAKVYRRTDWHGFDFYLVEPKQTLPVSTTGACPS